MGADRDYYADLELPPTADILEIKRQFRKLALKYHPDRNPGRESEVNAQFQIIQAAHEVLGDPTQKAKYDATLPRSRYTGASGVKGNPWSHVSDQFPAPPRRNHGTTRRNVPPQPPPPPSASGAQRWQDRFTSGHAPTAKQHHAANEAETKKSAARAFEQMRKNPASFASGSRPRPTGQPPPPPPRTESARQRREASFGARKTGYQPHAASGDDEPPVSRHSYYSSTAADPVGAKHAASPQKMRPTSMADPLSQFREPPSPMDPRLSTPYSKHGGEKTNPFDGTNLGRAKSERNPTQRSGNSSSDDPASSGHRKHRSSSVPRPAADQRLGDDLHTQAADARPHTSDTVNDGHEQSSFKSRASGHYPSRPAAEGSRSADESSTRPTRNAAGQSASGVEADQAKGHNMYEFPFKRTKTTATCGAFYMYGGRDHFTNYPLEQEWAKQFSGALDAKVVGASSGAFLRQANVHSFEQQQHQLIDHLIAHAVAALPRVTESHSTAPGPHQECLSDLTRSHSFTVPTAGSAFTQTATDPTLFSRDSTEDIDTSFVEDDGSQAYQFSAGGERPRARPKSRKSTANESPAKPAPATSQNPEVDGVPKEKHTDGAFNPNGWNDQFGPQTFVPPREQTASASPTRTNRKNSRKGKNLKATATAGSAVIIEDSSEDETFVWQGRKGQTAPGTDSPQAMDIDSPPARAPEAPSPLHSARNIHVEPSRPEWREGNVEGGENNAAPKQPSPGVAFGTTGGSEDSEEFRASLSDLKNVAPFAPTASGLKSFADLKDNLPFESKAATEAHQPLPKVQPLQFPPAPTAPRPPPTAVVAGITPNQSSWRKYLEEFQRYLGEWDQFNASVTDHFATRKKNIARDRIATGYSFLGTSGDHDVQKHYEWLQQDNDVRRRWIAACEEHEQRFREFMAFREKMK